MNNEPVAWIDPRELDMAVSTSVTKNKMFDTDIPLYTHPAKTLTDEEIEYLLRESIWALGLNTDCTEQENWDDAITVFRAILRKAQENG